jgi:putative sporulation protein YtaF
MLHGWLIIALAFAVSLDSFGVGTTYGLRKIRIPLVSTVIIAGCSGAVLYMGMCMGKFFSALFSPVFTQALGAVLLIVLGLWIILQGEKNLKETNEDEIRSQSPSCLSIKTWTFQIKRLGLVVKVLKTPVMADMDNSGSISSAEAFLLGTALSLDAFGAGIGAAMMGFPPVPTAFSIALMSALFLRLGMWIGFSCAKNLKNRFWAYMPGVILILLGMMRFM